MRKIPVKKLTLESFEPYGTFANMLGPKPPKIGTDPVEFFPDKLRLTLGDAHAASFSVCRVAPRPAIIDVVEYHNTCGEGILPLDGDVLLQVGPATPAGQVPLDQIEVFHVPRGTMVMIHPGVWHHAPFAYGKNPVNVLIVLPERTYVNDCHVHPLARAKQLPIQNGSR